MAYRYDAFRTGSTDPAYVTNQRIREAKARAVGGNPIVGGGQQVGGGPIGYANTLTPVQQQILGTGGNLITQLLSGGGNVNTNPFAMFTPEQTQQFYQQYFNPAEQAQFQQQVLPGVREAYVGPGTYWSGARANAEAQAQQDFFNQQQNRIGQMYLQQKQMGMQSLLPFALGLGGMETGVTYGIPRQQGGGGGMLANDLLRQLLQQQMGGQQQQQGGGWPPQWWIDQGNQEFMQDVGYTPQAQGVPRGYGGISSLIGGWPGVGEALATQDLSPDLYEDSDF